MMTSQSNDGTGEVAIVGMAARFPGAADVDRFWLNLVEGRESIRRLTDEELRRHGVREELVAQPAYVKAAATLEGVESFDAPFFGFSPREAEVMDPQFRLFLESAWATLEDAGYDAEQYRGVIGVFAGAAMSRYWLTHLLPQREALRSGGGALSAMTQFNDRDSLSTLVSFKLNLTGPSVTVQTACSTSLTAVHLACQSLLSGESDMALAGAVSLAIPQTVGYLYQEGNILSPDGHCRPFDARAKGTLPGSGLGLVLLKRLADAQADGDLIHAVIKGSALNNDGAQKAGYTAPSVAGQARVVTEALAMAGASADSIGYVEAHATGTELGDPIEVEALTRAFRRHTSRTAFCALGSVKSNFGHLDRAAGMASLLKAVMALKHQRVPPTLHFEQPNPKIDFGHSPFWVNTRVMDWPAGKLPRRAGVSSLGIGGTNVHLILEEAPPMPPSGTARPYTLILMSAKTPAALERMGANLARHLRAHPELPLADVAFTLHVGRRVLDYRRFVVACDREGLLRALEGGDPFGCAAVQTRGRSVWFLLGGQGTGESAGELYQHEPVFREWLDKCADLFCGVLPEDVRDRLGLRGESTHPSIPSNSALAVDCARFALEYALVQLWMSWGVQPAGVLGRGIGRYAAAACAGILEWSDAASLAHLWAKARETHDGEPLRALARRAILQAPRIPFLLTTQGDPMTEAEATNPESWARWQGDESPLPTASALPNSASSAVLIDVTSAEIELAPGSAAPASAAFESVAGSTQVEAADGRSALARRLAALGRLWLLGVPIDGMVFYAREQRRRVRLPTYPFEHQPYWIEAPAPNQPRLTGDPARERRLELDEWFYLPCWKRLPASRAKVTAATAAGVNWLIFLDADGLGDQVAEQIGAAGGRVAGVMAGTALAEFGPGRYCINPARPEDYRQLMARLRDRELLPDRVIHLWTATDGIADEVNSERFDPQQETGFYSLVYACQALEKEAPNRPVRWEVISSRVQNVIGQDPISPARAIVLGPCRVIPQEFPQMACRHIDVAWSGSDQRRELTDQLVGEVCAEPEPAAVALRGHHRWVQGFERVRLPHPKREALPLRDGGVYLIIGGLGGVGFALAQHLARVCRPRLILTGRTAMPPEGGAPTAAGSSDLAEATGRRGLRVQALEALGAEVWAVQADVADVTAMGALWSEARRRFGSIHGVIHAAGVRTPSALSELTPAAAEPHFRAKARGLQVLAQCIGEGPLDFCLVTSSLASVLGGLGSAAYTAANAFLDAFVERRNQSGQVHWICVNFDSWQPETAESPAPSGSAGAGRLAMTAAEGVEVFERALAFAPPSPLIVSMADLERRLCQWVRRGAPSEPARPPAAEVRRRHARPHLPTPYVAPGNAGEQQIAEIWQDLLGLEQVGRLDNFFDLGGHSLLLTHLHARLHGVFETDVPLIELFRHPTVAALANRVGSSAQATSFASVERRARRQQQSVNPPRRASRDDGNVETATRGRPESATSAPGGAAEAAGVAGPVTVSEPDAGAGGDGGETGLNRGRA
jgi:acyl transferase domain-containing protein